MRPQQPTDVLVVNGWYLDIPFPGIGANAIFETLSGVGKSTDIVEVVDAGTNIKHKFSSQLVDYSEMTLTRPKQGNSVDQAITVLVDTMLKTGVSLPVRAVKLHNGKEVFSLLFEGFRFISEGHPQLDTSGSDKYAMEYRAVCSGYTELPI